MSNPKVSIFTPTYNHERFIRYAAESVMKQEYDNWEMLIIDDESEDNTWAIVEELCKQDSRIRGVRNAHQGIWNLAKIYNQALKDSNGEIIAILDGDDFWPADKLRIQVPAHVTLGVGMSFGQMRYADIDGTIIKSSSSDRGTVELANLSGREIVLALLEGKFFSPAVTVLVNRSSLDRIGGFIQPTYLPVVDYPTWITIGFNDGLGYVDSLLGYWRQYSSQTTWRLSRDLARGAIRFSKEFILENQSLVGDNWESVLEASQRNRLPYLADALYRDVISSIARGDLAKSTQSINELKRFNTRMYLKARSVQFWKSLRRYTHSVFRS